MGEASGAMLGLGAGGVTAAAVAAFSFLLPSSLKVKFESYAAANYGKITQDFKFNLTFPATYLPGILVQLRDDGVADGLRLPQHLAELVRPGLLLVGI